MLESACDGDTAMRQRIEALLAAHEIAGDFLVLMPVERPATVPEEKPGDVIGHYTLRAKIGEGGFGSVYLAEQKLPVRRRVALKIIKLGMNTRAVMARFQGERQALAMMDHPDIARVFDAGATDTGRPFFVMEYVDGVPITKFCDTHRLSVTARLELFARVCLALQHAHQKGVIHRDIKPSNILVSLQDGVPTPKVIDFGIAKATTERITDDTLVTGLDQFMGTPSYMSPEQADRRDGDIDTRSDIYALGVLLYELLTGRLPFDPQTFAKLGFDEIRRRIREELPPRPSTRFATLLSADRTVIAARRDTTAPALAASLRGDLDWIAVHCLEKERDRRYGSAQELADDVRRHLRREPVEARPPSTAYRVERFVARHRVACASIAAIALSLIAGTIVSVRQAVLARRAERAAIAASHAEALARADAQRRQNEAEGLLTFMLGDFRTELQKIGRLQLLDTVGEKAMAYFAALDPRDLTDTALSRQAKALYQIGQTRMEEARYADAAAAFQVSYDRAAALTTRHPKDPDMLFERAQAEYWLGDVAWRRGDARTRLEWWTRYRDSTVALFNLEGPTPRAQLELSCGYHNLAIADSDGDRIPDAIAGFVAEREILKKLHEAKPHDLGLDQSLADNSSWLGSLAERQGDYGTALQRFAEMSAGYAELAQIEPVNPLWKQSMARSMEFSAGIKALLGKWDAALSEYSDANAILVMLAALDPKNQKWQLEPLVVRLQETSLSLAVGDTKNAQARITGVREILDALVAAEPSSGYFRFHLAMTERLEARIGMSIDRRAARETVNRALMLGDGLISTARANDAAKAEYANACILAGRLALADSQSDQAKRFLNQALNAISPRLAGSNYWRLLAPAAEALLLLGRIEDARPLVEKLHRFGYHASDPLAASLLEAALSPASPTSAQTKPATHE